MGRDSGPADAQQGAGPRPAAGRSSGIDELRERIYERALRLGLLVRAYVSRPDQRRHVRHELGEMLSEARGFSDEVGALSHGRPRPEVVVAGEEADRLVAMIGSLRKVIARLELLERHGTAEPGGARERDAKEAMRSEIDRLVAKVTEEEIQIIDLESEVDGLRRLRVRESGRGEEMRRLRKRIALAEARAKREGRRARRLERELREARRVKGRRGRRGRSGRKTRPRSKRTSTRRRPRKAGKARARSGRRRSS